MIVDGHLIFIFNNSLVYIYYNFSRLYKWVQYMRSFLCSLLIDIRVNIQQGNGGKRFSQHYILLGVQLAIVPYFNLLYST